MVGELIAQRYEIEEVVGTGGMSSVYKARDTLLERHVALKILHAQYTTDDEFVERFRREARAVAQLSHPNIVTVIDRGEDEGKQFIVFEYIDGENLKERLVKSGRLPVREALALALQVARALAFAHEHGLVHRDVKPQNVLLNGDGRAKVTDFGIARTLDVDGVTQTGTVLGTSNYIAPEQASGNRVDTQTDVYSLGVVLYELLAGDVPFPGENFVTVALKHVNEPPPNLLEVRNDVPRRVAAAVDRALEKDPGRRFPSMDAFAAELEACLVSLDSPDHDAGATIIARPTVTAERRGISTWAIAIAVLGAAALVAVAVALVVVHDRGGNGTRTITPVTHAVPLVGAGTFDPPPGDGHEHNEAVGRAVDHDAATYWLTETYRDFATTGKKGVGLVLDAGAAAPSITRVTIETDTPGFNAQLLTGATRGRFHPVTGDQQIQNGTTFQIAGGKMRRYLVLWLTTLPIGYAHV
ncbi:MAG TPA: protein kinase, partial [Gaiellaceae bacterium]|nr:protein kinase [Gaiellaceae bacterium]